TRAAVIAFQQEFLLAPDGVIGPLTWAKIVEMYLIVTGNVAVSLAYPGTPLRLGSRGSDVRLIQTFLNDIRVVHPGLPQVAVDGIFGPQTQAAVISFQSRFGLVPDGIVGPLTWNKIVQVRSQV
ncbi:MAG: peptidoglycan-binding protein, partial [Clostridiales bacterium]|nr:peptidoglycan-binding protein [Clostridiales bacterium]